MTLLEIEAKLAEIREQQELAIETQNEELYNTLERDRKDLFKLYMEAR